MSSKKVNWPSAAQPEVTTDELSDQIRFFRDLGKLGPVHKRNPEEIQERVDQYFDVCIDHSIRPSVEGLTIALGVSRQTFLDWEKTGSEAGQIVAQAKAILNGLLTHWEMTGKINPAAAIWLQKNNSGYTDNTVLTVQPPQRQDMPSLSRDDLAALMGSDEEPEALQAPRQAPPVLDADAIKELARE